MRPPSPSIPDTQKTDLFCFQKDSVRTRFAPSPTGFLHIGGIRTAIFNWAWARRHGGKFYLRIDDTDQQRHVDGAIDRILEDFSWLGLNWDAAEILQGVPGSIRPATEPNHLIYASGRSMTEPGVVYQSLRGYSYLEALDRIRDYTYPCDCKDAKFYDYNPDKRTCSCRYYRETGSWPLEDFCIRFDVEKAHGSEGPLIVDDLILGPVSCDLRTISDPVIFRSGGCVVYSFANVVDDHDMGISHVIRGQEHLSNTFVQLLMLKALGWRAPKYAHIPIICAPNTTRKLSKRDADDMGIPVTVAEYKRLGYIPDALFNYLSHLGWAMDGSTEKWTKEQFVAAFDFKGTGKNPAQFDLGKLSWLCGEYYKEKTTDERVAIISDYLGEQPDVLRAVVVAADDRIKKASDIEQYRHFWDESSFAFDPDAVSDRLLNYTSVGSPDRIVQGYMVLEYFLDHLLDDSIPWTAEGIHEELKTWADKNIKPAVLIHALRAATTGQKVGFGVFEGMEILGRERCVDRITKAINHCKSM